MRSDRLAHCFASAISSESNQQMRQTMTHEMPKWTDEELQMKPVERIHIAAQRATWNKFDQAVHLSQDLNLYELRDRGVEGQRCYLDVPLGCVIALIHHNFFKGSWRDAAMGLHGEGWSEAIFDYMDKPQLENVFPAQGARGALEMICVGGASECTNGMHRLAASLAWLGCRDGFSASLKQVHMTAYRLDPVVKSALQKLRREGRGIWIGTPNPSFIPPRTPIEAQVHVAFTPEYDPESIYVVRHGELSQIQKRRGVFERLVVKKQEDVRQRFVWHFMQEFVVLSLLDDAWVSRQIHSARRFGEVLKGTS
jgi:hypothetical protein